MALKPNFFIGKLASLRSLRASKRESKLHQTNLRMMMGNVGCPLQVTSVFVELEEWWHVSDRASLGSFKGNTGIPERLFLRIS